MKLVREKPLSRRRKIVYTLILFLLLSGGPLGILLGGLSIAWVWRQKTLQTTTRINTRLAIMLLAVSGLLLYVGVVTYSYFRAKPQIPVTSVTTQGEAKQSPTARDFLREINKQRKKAGVAPLELDKRLNASASKKAREMAREGLDSTPHVNDKGIFGQEYIKEVWPSCFAGGENLVWYFNDEKDAVKWWANSPGHRSTMLNPHYQYLGVGLTADFAVTHYCQTS